MPFGTIIWPLCGSTIGIPLPYRLGETHDGLVVDWRDSCMGTEYKRLLELLFVACVTFTIVRLLGSTMGTARVRGDWRRGEPRWW